jgi:hypothetical protein
LSAVAGASDYVNPLGGARVRPERIDQGVDYAGSGTLVAIGGGTVTYVARTGTGWPGAFVAAILKLNQQTAATGSHPNPG